MRLPGRLSAAIDILTDFDARRVPLKTAIADWARGARYAGAKDRAWISGLCLDVLRKRNSLAASMGADAPRPLVLGAIHYLWRESLDALEEACAEEHGPGALSEEERTLLSQDQSPDGAGTFHNDNPNAPEWVAPYLERAFGERAAAEGAALSERAAVDLRMNTLKSAPEKTMSALKSVKAQKIGPLTTSARIEAPDPSQKAPAVTVIPAFNKGWVEVQDLGSQIAAAAAGAIEGAQVFDYCAGGGGKTLALAAMMNNTGQLYAHDIDRRRLAPLYHRAKRAGVRNLQVVDPKEGADTLAGLQEKMDVVFLDAPCSGAGTWRRRPDTKWRLTPTQLETRLKEQDEVLGEGARFVKPGGRLIYVTCSFFVEENDDRVAAFLNNHSEFSQIDPAAEIAASGLMSSDESGLFASCLTASGALQLSPLRAQTDGFYIAALRRK